jgi:hypothetical protein
MKVSSFMMWMLNLTRAWIMKLMSPRSLNRTADDLMAGHSLREADDYESEAFDNYIAAEVLVPKDDMLTV